MVSLCLTIKVKDIYISNIVKKHLNFNANKKKIRKKFKAKKLKQKTSFFFTLSLKQSFRNKFRYICSL